MLSIAVCILFDQIGERKQVSMKRKKKSVKMVTICSEWCPGEKCAAQEQLHQAFVVLCRDFSSQLI